MNTEPIDLLQPKNNELLFDSYNKQLRDAKSLPDESRQSLAKFFLSDFAERLLGRCINISIADKYTRMMFAANIRHKSELFHCRFRHFEKAMERTDYILALHELHGVIHFLPAWHELIYNNFARVFNAYLNTNLQPMEMKMEHSVLSPELRAATPLWNEEDEAKKYLHDILFTLNDLIEHTDNMEEIFAAYDFYIVFMREELRIGMIGDYIHGAVKGDMTTLAHLFPNKYTIDGNIVDAKTNKYVGAPIQVSDTCLVSCVWDKASIPGACLNINSNGFVFNSDNHKCAYYPEINLCYVTSGFHHLAMASLLRTGIITPEETCSLAQFYPYVRSNGAFWIDIKSDQAICKARDFRLAAIYELCRRKQELLGKSRPLNNH
jgi:hypothetical protein